MANTNAQDKYYTNTRQNQHKYKYTVMLITAPVGVAMRASNRPTACQPRCLMNCVFSKGYLLRLYFLKCLTGPRRASHHPWHCLLNCVFHKGVFVNVVFSKTLTGPRRASHPPWHCHSVFLKSAFIKGGRGGVFLIPKTFCFKKNGS